MVGVEQGPYGIRRIHKDLAAEGITVSLGLVAAIMRELGIAGVQPRATKRTTIPAADAQDRADLVRREFNPPVPTTHLVSDITYLKTGEGWLFLATVIDLTTRMVVGWATAKHMRTSLIIDALKVAYQGGYVAEGAIAHSDRGSQYTSAEYAEVARLMQVRLSVGRTGVCWDNAVAEAFFASLKNEMFHRQRFATRARARLGGRGVYRGVLQPEEASLGVGLRDPCPGDGVVLRSHRDGIIGSRPGCLRK